MTTTPLNYFDKVPGTLEQLVLGVITQKLINQDFLPDLLKTDFTTNAIDWNVTLDSGDGLNFAGNLTLSMTFPTLPYDRQILTDRDTFDKRVMSINSLSVDTLSLPQNPNYPIKSIEAKLPSYLSLDVNENILERRLVALCLYIRAYYNWIDRWNTCQYQWILAKYWNGYQGSLSAVEDTREKLLLEFINGFKYTAQYISQFGASNGSGGFNPPDNFPIIALDDNPATAKELSEFLSGSNDPASNSSPISESLLEILTQSNSSYVFGGNSPETPNQPEPEKPSLPNC